MGFKISGKAIAAAEAAKSFDLTEPEEGGAVPVKVNTDKKGNLYKRWTEDAKIVALEQSERTVDNEKGKRNHTQFYIRLQVKATSPLNKGRFIHARHSINKAEIEQGVTDGPDAYTNESSIRALSSLFQALGVLKPGGDITEEMLNDRFPKKDAPGVAQPLWAGKDVVVEMVGSPRRDGKGRQTQAEGYLPAKKV